MKTYQLEIFTFEEMQFCGDVESLVVRTISGDVCILHGHADYVTIIKEGYVRLKLASGELKKAIVKGGVLAVIKGRVRLIVVGIQWE